MMQYLKALINRHQRGLIFGGLAMFGFLIGFFCYESNWFAYRILEESRFALSIFLLVYAWRFITDKYQGFFLLFGWYLGATWAIPFIWLEFFSHYAGFVVQPILCLLLASPILLFKKKYLGISLAITTSIAAFTPLGLGTPFLAATVFFAGWGFAGLASTFWLLSTPVTIKREGLFQLVFIGVIGYGMANAGVMKPTSDLWATTSFNGQVIPSLKNTTERIKEAAEIMAIKPKLLLTYEGMESDLNLIAAGQWMMLQKLLPDTTLLLGAYAHNNNHTRVDAIINAVTGKRYPATFPMPFGMWHPWNSENHYPIQWSSLSKVIPIPSYGNAAYAVCFEELSMLPITVKMVNSDVRLILSVANQWFAKGWIMNGQARSIHLQARLWGKPLLRAVNYPQQN